jgi:hypothetical protein|tara:strand:- start:232 stop:1053 length:822 start_codon:yes stop_codon:yes gene_type:complete
MSLYKYYHPDSFDFICVEGGVSARFSQPDLLNDTYEFNGSIDEQLFLDRTRNILEESGIPTNSIENEKIKTLSERLKKYFIRDYDNVMSTHIKNKMGIFSLSVKKHSRAMWSYYSHNHSGFMISFSTNEEFHPPFIQGDDNFGKGHVKYTDIRPESILALMKKSDAMKKNDSEKMLLDFFLTKDDHWKHEEEFRIIASVNDLPSTKIDHHGFRIHSFTVPAHQIESITLGVRASDDLERKARIWIEDNQKKIKLYRATPCNLRYDFEDIKLTI